MKIRLATFNIYLLLSALAWSTGCRTPEERQHAREASTLRVYVDTGRNGNSSGGITVYRSNPIQISVEREPFLTEAELESAAVIDMPGGFGIQAQFNGHGAMILEQVTVAHKGEHLAIQSTFSETRWLAAPVITRRISNGQLIFTPDATRDEADRIVRGVTNVIAKIKKKESSVFSSP
jgi:hypothetical protein